MKYLLYLICFLLELNVITCNYSILSSSSSLNDGVRVYSDCSTDCVSESATVQVSVDVSNILTFQQEHNLSENDKYTVSLLRANLTVVSSQVVTTDVINFSMEHGIYYLHISGEYIGEPCSFPGMESNSCFTNNILTVTATQWNFVETIYKGPITEYITVDTMYTLFPWSQMGYPWKFAEASTLLQNQVSLNDSTWNVASSWSGITTSSNAVEVRRSFFLTSSQVLAAAVLHIQSRTPFVVYINEHLLFSGNGVSTETESVWQTISFSSMYLLEGKNVLYIKLNSPSESNADCFMRFISDESYAYQSASLSVDDSFQALLDLKDETSYATTLTSPITITFSAPANRYYGFNKVCLSSFNALTIPTMEVDIIYDSSIQMLTTLSIMSASVITGSGSIPSKYCWELPLERPFKSLLFVISMENDSYDVEINEVMFSYRISPRVPTNSYPSITSSSLQGVTTEQCFSAVADSSIIRYSLFNYDFAPLDEFDGVTINAETGELCISPNGPLYLPFYVATFDSRGYFFTSFTVTRYASCLYESTMIMHNKSVVINCPEYHTGSAISLCNNGTMVEDNTACIPDVPTSFFYSIESSYTVNSQFLLEPVIQGGVFTEFTSTALPDNIFLNNQTGIISGIPTENVTNWEVIVMGENTSGNLTTVISFTFVYPGCEAEDGYSAAASGDISINNERCGTTGYVYKRCINGTWSEEQWDQCNTSSASLSYDVNNPYYKGQNVVLVATIQGGGFMYNTGAWSATNLPDGLQINGSNGRITGQPTTNCTNCEVTVTNTPFFFGSPISTTFSLTILLRNCTTDGVYAGVPSGEISTSDCPQYYSGYTYRLCYDSEFDDIQYDQCIPILPTVFEYDVNEYYYTDTPITIEPSIVGGILTSYEASDLPNGLTINTTTGVISGTVTQNYTDISVIVTGSNTNGTISTTFNLTALYRPCDGVDGYLGVASGQISTLENCPQYYTGYTYRTCFNGEFNETQYSSCIPVPPTNLQYSPEASYLIHQPFLLVPTYEGISEGVTCSNLPDGLQTLTNGTITGVAVSTNATYTVNCVLSNSSGSTNATFQLNMIYPPCEGVENYAGVASGEISKNENGCDEFYEGYTYRACFNGTFSEIQNACNLLPPVSLSYTTNSSYYMYQYLQLSAEKEGIVTLYESSLLPNGLSIDASSGVISGVPNHEAGTFAFTVTASNTAGSKQYTITLNLIYPGCEALDNYPAAASGSTSVDYNGCDEFYTGYTYRTCFNGTFSVIYRDKCIVLPPTSISYTTSNSYELYNELLITSSAIGVITSYTSTTLPAGLVIDSSSGDITGIPTEVHSSFVFTVTGSNTSGETSTVISLKLVYPHCEAIDGYPEVASGEKSIILNSCDEFYTGYTYRNCFNGTFSAIQKDQCSLLAPTSISYSISFSYILYTPLTLAVNAVGKIFEYTSTELPAGLSLNNTTGMISGIPTESKTNFVVTVTASNSAGQTTTSIPFTLVYPGCSTLDQYSGVDSGEISTRYDNCDYGYTGYTYRSCFNGTFSDIQHDQCILLPPISIAYTRSNFYYLYDYMSLEPDKQGVISTYSSTTLPEGLDIDETTGIISGVPIEAVTNFPITITGSNAAGSVTTTISLTLLYLNCEDLDNYEGVASGEISRDINGCPPHYYGYTYRSCFNGTFDTIQLDECHVLAPSSLYYTLSSFYYVYSPIELSAHKIGIVDSYNSTTLPDGLTLDSESGTISGIPTVNATNYQVTVTASNESGSTSVTITFVLHYPGCDAWNGYASASSGSISTLYGGCGPGYNGFTYVNCFNGTFSEVQRDECILLAPAALHYTVNNIYYVNSMLTLIPTKTGVITSYTSTLLPEGLSLNNSTGIITGTPTVNVTDFAVTVTGSNSAGSVTDEIHFTILYPGCESIPGYEGVASGEISKNMNGCPGDHTGYAYRYCFNGQFDDIQYNCIPVPPNSLSYSMSSSYPLYSAIHLTAVHTAIITSYSSSPLPPGLFLDPTSGTISGTPTTLAENYQVTITGSNAGGDIICHITFTFIYPGCEVDGSVIPSGSTLNMNTCPPFHTGYTYRNCFNGTLSDVKKDQCNLLPPSSLHYVVSSFYYINSPILLNFTSTGEITSYTSTLLPEGLSLNNSTGIITGIPTVNVTDFAVTITGSNSAGSVTDEIHFTILYPGCSSTVDGYNGVASGEKSSKYGNCEEGYTGYTYRTCFNGTFTGIKHDECILLPPSGLSYPVSSSYYLYDPLEISPSSSSIILEYSAISLPTGLSLNSTTGEISGIPTVENGIYLVTITASNPSGDTSYIISFNFIYKGCNSILNYEGVASGEISRNYAGCLQFYTGYTYRSCFNGTFTDIQMDQCTPLPPSHLTYSWDTTFYVYSELQLHPNYNALIQNFTSSVLPLGLSIHPTEGIISGTPLVNVTNYPVTITGSNSAGSTETTIFLTILYPACSAIPGYSGVASGEISKNHNNCPQYYAGYTYRSCFNGTFTGIFTDQCSLLPPSSISYSMSTSYVMYTPVTLTVTKVGIVQEYTSTALPNGLTLDAASGTISGIPDTEPSDYLVTVTATNSGGSATTTLTISLIYPGCSTTEDGYAGVASGTNSNNYEGCNYGFTGYTYRQCFNGTWSVIYYDHCVLQPPSLLSYSLNSMYYLYSYVQWTPTTAGHIDFFTTNFLPSGLSLNTTTGMISGTPSEYGDFAVTVTATNNAGSLSTQLTLVFRYPGCEAVDGYDAVESGMISVNPNGCQQYYSGYTFRSCFNSTWSETDYSNCILLPLSVSYNAEAFYFLYKEFTLTPQTTGMTEFFNSTTLPDGLYLNHTTGVISGIPTANATSYVVAVTASNLAGSNATDTIHLNFLYPGCDTLGEYQGVLSGEKSYASGCDTYYSGQTYRICFNETFSDVYDDECQPIRPENLTYSIDPVYYVYSSLTLTPTVDGIVSTYDVSGLPSGLTLDPSSGVISGIPLEEVYDRHILVTASNQAGPATFNIVLNIRYPGCSSLDNFEAVESGEKSYFDGCDPYYEGQVYRSCYNGTFSEIYYDECLVLPPVNLTYVPSVILYLESDCEVQPEVEGVITLYTSTRLPTGLYLNATSGVISGVPVEKVTDFEVVITGSNERGSITYSILFTIEYDGCNALEFYPADVVGASHSIDCKNWDLNGKRQIQCIVVDGKKQWVVVNDGCFSGSIYVFTILIAVVLFAVIGFTIYTFLLQSNSRKVVIKMGEVYI